MLPDRFAVTAARVAVSPLTAAGLIWAGVACAPSTGGPGSEAVVVVAADLALTGSGAELGTIHHDALRLRVAQVNKRGLPGGRQVELRVRDNRSDPAISARHLAALAGTPEVAAIVTGGSGLAEAADALNAAGVPTFVLAPVAPVATSRYLFPLAPDPADTADVLAAELAATDAAAVGLVTVDDGYGAVGAREMTDAASWFGVDIVAAERHPGAADQRQVAALAARIAGRRPEAPDAVVLWTYPDHAGRLAVALRAAGWRGRLFLDAAAAGSAFLAGETGEALADARLVSTEMLAADTPLVATPVRAARRAWFRDYLSEYGDYHAPASYAADAVDLIVAADHTDRDSVRNAVEATRREGLTGPYDFRPAGRPGLDPRALRLLVATGERWYTSDD